MGKKFLFGSVFLILFLILFITFDKGEDWKTEDFYQRVSEYNIRTEKKKRENEEKQARRLEILENTPGIVCWGDEITLGGSESYPSFLSDLIKQNGYPYEVFNLGVLGEDSRTVLGRNGALPFAVKEDFNIEGNGKNLIELGIMSSDGSGISGLKIGKNSAINPCSINGVKCNLYISENGKYCIRRADNSSKTVNVKAGDIIETSGSKEYKDYINILQIGDNGGYSSDSELYSQYRAFIEKFKGEKFIVIGRISGSYRENRYIDRKMEREFGENYLNPRDIFEKEFEKDSENKVILSSEDYSTLAKAIYQRLYEIELLEK